MLKHVGGADPYEALLNISVPNQGPLPPSGTYPISRNFGILILRLYTNPDRVEKWLVYDQTCPVTLAPQGRHVHVSFNCDDIRWADKLSTADLFQFAIQATGEFDCDL